MGTCVFPARCEQCEGIFTTVAAFARVFGRCLHARAAMISYVCSDICVPFDSLFFPATSNMLFTLAGRRHAHWHARVRIRPRRRRRLRKRIRARRARGPRQTRALRTGSASHPASLAVAGLGKRGSGGTARGGGPARYRSAGAGGHGAGGRGGLCCITGVHAGAGGSTRSGGPADVRACAMSVAGKLAPGPASYVATRLVRRVLRTLNRVSGVMTSGPAASRCALRSPSYATVSPANHCASCFRVLHHVF